MALSSSRLELHDVRDAAAFVGRIIERSGLSLSWTDRQDLEQHLLIEAWSLSLVYEAGGISFSTFAGSTLRLRVVDWQRATYGRTVWKFKGRVHERERPAIVSLDADDSRGDRLERALAASYCDRAPDRDEDCRGLLGDRDSARARDFDALGLEPPRRAA